MSDKHGDTDDQVAVPVTEMRLRLREVVRVRHAETTEQAVIEGEVRREVMEIERTDE
jgi:hypothetical protein